MINFDKLIFGYVVFSIKECDVACAVNRMLRAGLNQRIDKKGQFAVPYRSVKLYSGILSGIDYKVSCIKGLLGLFLRLRSRYGIIPAVALFLVLMRLSVNTVWDVRVEGCSNDIENEVISELEAAGVKVGAFWFGVDKRDIENKILLASDDISWISINRRGSVAYVSVIERSSHVLPPKPDGYASIVADRDCIIEQITVKSGYPTVKVGDSVKKGDVLISGVIPKELGGGYCYADGSVKGRYTTDLVLKADAEIEERVPLGNSIYTIGVKILGFKINIFKNYGKIAENYDIIRKNKEFTFLGKKIPLSLEYEIAEEYAKRTIYPDYSDMVKAVSNELTRSLAEDFADEEILSIKTHSPNSEGVYSVTAKLVLRAEVTEIKEFEYKSEKE